MFLLAMAEMEYVCEEAGSLSPSTRRWGHRVGEGYHLWHPGSIWLATMRHRVLNWMDLLGLVHLSSSECFHFQLPHLLLTALVNRKEMW